MWGGVSRCGMWEVLGVVCGAWGGVVCEHHHVVKLITRLTTRSNTPLE